MTDMKPEVPDDSRPIAFRLPPGGLSEAAPRSADGAVVLRTRTRTLAGMQKEAMVEDAWDGSAWRLLCDEGPWLNGTDLAPFPLGYFAAGVAACFMSDILAQAAEAGVWPTTLDLRVDHFFTMEGSILKGTMAAGVEPIHLVAGAGGDIEPARLGEIVRHALNSRSAAHRTLAARLPGRFCLSVNGQAVEWPGYASELVAGVADPARVFDGLEPAPQPGLREPIVRKDETSATAASGGAVGLQTEQKRTVHIHSHARLRADGLKEIAVQCLTPPGSRFVFLSDDAPSAGGHGRAPCGLTYLSAGVAFCFMTQLGRYASIRKMRLNHYRIVQRTAFGPGEAGPSPVETAVFLDSEDSAENNLRMVQMGEQTCYLHTAFREPVEVLIEISGADA